MNWTLLGDVVKVLAPVATAGAAWFAAVIAYRGLNKWRAETIGKRRAELAEEVLADFYQARDIINAARSPGSFSHEGATRQKANWESEDDTRTLNAYFAAAERLNKKVDFFAQLHARRYRFIAHFGVGAGKSYDQLHAIYAEIVVAVRMLVETYQHRDLGSLPENRKAWLMTIGWEPDKDKIPSRLDSIIDDIETVCRPAIEAVK